MKTLREYIDQLDEISRRDFLRGAGAAALGGAIGYKMQSQTSSKFDKNPKVVWLIGYTVAAADYMIPSQDTLEIKKIRAEYLKSMDVPGYDSKGASELYGDGITAFYDDVAEYHEQHNIKQPRGFIRGSDTERTKWITLKGKEALIKLKSLLQESQISETTDEVERVVQLAKEMR